MPGWAAPPDVRFDHDAAARALAELQLARHAVSEALERQGPAREWAMISWRGRTRDLTEEWLTHHHWALESLVGRLRELETGIGDAMDDAILEQQRRERLQDQWWREWREERDEQLAALVEAGSP